ncbi:MAG TPA: 4,5-DOPA dioxygenase extradiol [Rhodanobacteraceae bacterium]
MNERMPVVFIGHGTPMNAIEDNRWSQAWRDLARDLPRPRAIVCVSAHWYRRGTAVTAMSRPPTIHDFGGFPPALFNMAYPAPGDPALAQRIIDLLAPESVAADLDWGLDHGAWSVLCHLYPDADIPVVQVAIDRLREPAFHYALGQRLRALRDEGVLLLASGNVVHNLRALRMGGPAHPWAERFEATVRRLVADGEHAALVDYPALGADAALSIPTPDHYLPLLYALGASDANETPLFPVTGIDGGALSMLSVRWG